MDMPPVFQSIGGKNGKNELKYESQFAHFETFQGAKISNFSISPMQSFFRISI
jgi:hypothetical protein